MTRNVVTPRATRVGARRRGAPERFLTFWGPQRRSRPWGFFVLLLAATTAVCTAENGRAPQDLNLGGAVRYAFAHAPTLLAREADLANSIALFTQRRASEFPSLSGQLQNQIAKSSNLSGSFAQFGISPLSNFSQNTAQILSQFAFYNGSAQLAAGQAKRNAENAAGELRTQQATTALDVAHDFYGLAALRQATLLDEGDLAYQRQLLDVARAQERVGRVAGVDVLRAQVAVSRSTATLVQARADEGNSREALAVEIGASPDATFRVPAEIPEPPLSNASTAGLTAIAKANRPEVAAAKAALGAARLADAAVDIDLRPTFQLSGSFGNQETTTSPFFRNRPGFWSLGAVSTFSVPVVDYGTRAANHRAARARIAATAAAYENALDAVERDVRNAVRSARTAFDKLKLAKEAAGLARESARIAQLQYRNGLISFSDISQTQQTTLAAENDLIAARVGYVVAAIRLRLTLGLPDLIGAVDLSGNIK